MDRIKNLNMISVHGLYRSGTNYVTRLLKENTSLRVLNKEEYNVHELHQPSCKPETRQIVVYKTLDSWLKSISRRGYDLECYHDVLWEENHTPLKSWAGVPITFEGKHEVILSVEKLTKLYKKYIENIQGEKFLYNNIINDPEKFLKELNIPLNDKLILEFDQVESSDNIIFRDLKEEYPII